MLRMHVATQKKSDPDPSCRSGNTTTALSVVYGCAALVTEGQSEDASPALGLNHRSTRWAALGWDDGRVYTYLVCCQEGSDEVAVPTNNVLPSTCVWYTDMRYEAVTKVRPSHVHQLC